LSYFENIPDLLESTKLLLLGFPSGVGFTTSMAKYLANQLFFENNYSALVLVNSEWEKSQYVQHIEDMFLDIYKYESYQYQNNILTVENNYVQIVNVHKEDISFDSDHIFNLMLIDNEQADSIYYEVLSNNANFERVIVGTYDYSDSLYYKVDERVSIRIYSNLSQSNIEELKEKEILNINEEKLIRGNFSQYI